MRNAEWFARETKTVVFDLPDAEYSDDAERTLRRSRSAVADSTEEVDPRDVLAEFPLFTAPATMFVPSARGHASPWALPADPEEPFELRVPDVILDRAAQLTAGLPRLTSTRAPSRIERTGWVVATVLGACVGILFAGAMAYAAAAPIEPAPAPHLRAAPARKALSAPLVALGTGVPTVSFESLPRARR
jgi:hypothetical protein